MYIKTGQTRVIGLFCTIFSLCLIFACVPKQGMIEMGATIAVWDLDNLSQLDNIPDLGEALSAKIIESISEKGDYTFIERERLLLALEELNIGSQYLADEETRLRLGRLLGARFMIFGGYHSIGGLMRVDLRLVDVESGRVVNASERTTTSKGLDVWLQAAAEAAEGLF